MNAKKETEMHNRRREHFLAGAFESVMGKPFISANPGFKGQMEC